MRTFITIAFIMLIPFIILIYELYKYYSLNRISKHFFYCFYPETLCYKGGKDLFGYLNSPPNWDDDKTPIPSEYKISDIDTFCLIYDHFKNFSAAYLNLDDDIYAIRKYAKMETQQFLLELFYSFLCEHYLDHSFAGKEIYNSTIRTEDYNRDLKLTDFGIEYYKILFLTSISLIEIREKEKCNIDDPRIKVYKDAIDMGKMSVWVNKR